MKLLCGETQSRNSLVIDFLLAIRNIRFSIHQFIQMLDAILRYPHFIANLANCLHCLLMVSTAWSPSAQFDQKGIVIRDRTMHSQECRCRGIGGQIALARSFPLPFPMPYRDRP